MTNEDRLSATQMVGNVTNDPLAAPKISIVNPLYKLVTLDQSLSSQKIDNFATKSRSARTEQNVIALDIEDDKREVPEDTLDDAPILELQMPTIAMEQPTRPVSPWKKNRKKKKKVDTSSLDIEQDRESENHTITFAMEQPTRPISPRKKKKKKKMYTSSLDIEQGDRESENHTITLV